MGAASGDDAALSARAGNARAVRRVTAAFVAVIAGVLVSWPATAWANTGLPMLYLVWPASWVAFVPVVLVEAFVARHLLGLAPGESLKLSMIANLWSTLAGIPVTWALLVVVEMLLAGFLAMVVPAGAGPFLKPLGVILSAPWLPPDVETWTVFFAAAVLCVPLCWMSMRVEAWSARGRVSKCEARRWARVANLFTYGPIIVLLAVQAIASALRR